MILLIDSIFFSITFLLLYLLEKKDRYDELNEIEEGQEIIDILSIDNNINYYDACNIYMKKKYLKQNNRLKTIIH